MGLPRRTLTSGPRREKGPCPAGPAVGAALILEVGSLRPSEGKRGPQGRPVCQDRCVDGTSWSLFLRVVAGWVSHLCASLAGQWREWAGVRWPRFKSRLFLLPAMWPWASSFNLFLPQCSFPDWDRPGLAHKEVVFVRIPRKPGPGKTCEECGHSSVAELGGPQAALQAGGGGVVGVGVWLGHSRTLDPESRGRVSWGRPWHGVLT